MKHVSIFLITAALIAPGASFGEKPEQYQQDISIKAAADGSFQGESAIKQVDKDGTTHFSKTKQEREIQRDGKIKEVIKDTATTNPKGMLNEEALDREVTRTANPDGTTRVAIEENFVNRSGTKVERSATARKVVKEDGNIETKVTGVEKRDPKGLFNSSEIAVTETIEKRPDGSIVKKEQVK